MDTDKHTPSLTARVLVRLGPLAVLVKRFAKRRWQESQILQSRPKYPHIRVCPESGDPEHILRSVVGGMVFHDVPEAEIQEFIEEALSDDYGHMLVTISRWVVVVNE